MAIIRIFHDEYKTLNLKAVAHTVRALMMEDKLINYGRIICNGYDTCSIMVTGDYPYALLKMRLEGYCPWVKWMVEY